MGLAIARTPHHFARLARVVVICCIALLAALRLPARAAASSNGPMITGVRPSRGRATYDCGEAVSAECDILIVVQAMPLPELALELQGGPVDLRPQARINGLAPSPHTLFIAQNAGTTSPRLICRLS